MRANPNLKNASIMGDRAKASQFIDNLKGKNFVFICAIANTKTVMVLITI